MRVFRILAMLALLLPVAARADDADSVAAADRTAIRAVVQQQMAAFQRDDGPGAFAFASPGIRSQFSGDPDVFMSMVRRSYQPVYRPKDTVFGAVTREQGQVVQHVLVTAPDGSRHEALYLMEHEADGSWKISGCMLTESASVGA